MTQIDLTETIKMMRDKPSTDESGEIVHVHISLWREICDMALAQSQATPTLQCGVDMSKDGDVLAIVGRCGDKVEFILDGDDARKFAEKYAKVEVQASEAQTPKEPERIWAGHFHDGRYLELIFREQPDHIAKTEYVRADLAQRPSVNDDTLIREVLKYVDEIRSLANKSFHGTEKYCSTIEFIADKLIAKLKERLDK